MSANNRTPVTPALTSCQIVPSDFCKRTTERAYRFWTAGAMRHVQEALDGAPVAIVTDTGTGHTCMNVRLVGVTEAASGVDATVHVLHIDDAYNYRPGIPTAYRLSAVGMVLPLTDAGQGAKWDATRSYMKEASAAVQRAQREHGEGRYGTWDARPGVRSVTVTIEPYRAPHYIPEGDNVGDKGRFAHWSYPVAELAEVAA